jgi:hypothetical protein
MKLVGSRYKLWKRVHSYLENRGVYVESPHSTRVQGKHAPASVHEPHRRVSVPCSWLSRDPEAGRATWWYRTVHCSAIASLAPTTTRKQGDRQARLSLQTGDFAVVHGSKLIRSDCHSGSLILLLARCEKRPPRPVMQASVCPLHIKPNK